MIREPYDDEARNRRVDFITACLAFGLLVILLVVSVHTINGQNDALATLSADLAAVQGKLARSELLVEQYRQEKKHLEAENAKLKTGVMTVASIGTKEQLFAALRELATHEKGLLLLVGYVGADGDAKALKASDLYRCDPDRPVPAFEHEWTF